MLAAFDGEGGMSSTRQILATSVAVRVSCRASVTGAAASSAEIRSSLLAGTGIPQLDSARPSAR